MIPLFSGRRRMYQRKIQIFKSKIPNLFLTEALIDVTEAFKQSDVGVRT